MDTKKIDTKNGPANRAGDEKKSQRYQNNFKFAHNTKSKKTEKIVETPLDFLCQRCYDTLQWKIDYRKYKPLAKGRKCQTCDKMHIFKAYRQICDPCAMKDKKEGKVLCTKCTQNVRLCVNANGKPQYAVPQRQCKWALQKQEEETQLVQDILDKLRIRLRRTVERKIEAGEIKYSKQKKGLVYTEDQDKDYEIKGANESDGEDDFESANDEQDDDSNHGESDGKKEKKDKVEKKKKGKDQKKIIENKIADPAEKIGANQSGDNDDEQPSDK